jgi:hypothetical protein
LVLGLHVGEVGLGTDVALEVKAVEIHLVIVADQVGSGMKRLPFGSGRAGWGSGVVHRPGGDQLPS